MTTITDIEAERQAASFSIRNMMFLLDNDPSGEFTADKERVRALLPISEAPFDKSDSLFLSRRDRFRRSLLLHREIELLAQKHGLSTEQKNVMIEQIGEVLPTSTHDLIFTGGIRALGDDEQQAEWLPLCESYKIIGAYAQTELGHGSNIRGLETTAVYHQATEEFELHSPTLTSTKWWPGSMGACATHAIVFAMLSVNGEPKGMHGFIVPIREPATHLELPGVCVGDIGPKLGMSTVDNGFLRLDRVRVPRRNMLSRHSRVSPDGVYSSPASSQMNYATMLHARVSYVRAALNALSVAVTVAGRYGCVRRQGGDGNGSERRLMDWRTHQRIFLPVLATAYCFHFCGTALRALYECVQAGKDTYPGYGKVQLGAVHITIAGVKVMVTSLGSSGMETCRRLCGGHGYSLSSGIPERWATFTHTTTAEGDNTVMALQVGKALLKLVGAGKNGSLPYLWDPSATLAETCPGSAPADFLQPKVFLHCLRHRACRLAVELASSQRRRREEAGEPAAQALNADLPMVMRAGEAHSELMMAEFFVEGVSHDSVETELRPPLQRLCALFALDTLEKALGDLLEDGYLAGRAPALRAAIDVLLTQIRPDTVALVDAFNHSDYALHSSIGRADGQVYPALWDHAQRATAYLIHTGTDGVVDGWREAIAPMTRQSRL